MDDKNITILQPDDLIAEIKSQSEAITGSMNNQLTTLQLLDGTLLMSFGMQSQLFAGMLGELALQSSFSSAQLGEQQLYDAAALEGASAMYLLLSTLSGNVEGILNQLVALGGYGDGISGDVAKIAPLIDQMANSGGGINDAANTAFGAVGAVASLGQAGTQFKKVTEIGGAIGGLGQKLASAAGIVGKLGALAPLLTSAAPLLVGGLAVAGIGTMAYKAYKNHKAKKEAEAADDTAAGDSGSADSDKNGGASAAATNAPRIPPTIDPAQALIDPFNTGEGDKSNYNQYQSQVDSSRANADALREAVKTGNAEVAAQIGALADAIHRLADKPADRKVNSEITIQSLRTHATLSEFRDMLNEVLKMEEQVSA